MNTAALNLTALAITLLLLARWILLPETSAIRKTQAILLAAIQAAIWSTLCYAVGERLWFLLAGMPLALAPLVLIPLEKRKDAPCWRLATLLPVIAPLCLAIIPGTSALSPIARLLLCFAGALLCLKESNYVVRALLLRIKNPVNPAETNILPAATDNGRIIGSLERLLVYVLLLTGQSLAVTAVIAIKALARFKRMETDQSFAEYVVIGTFLSLLLACLLAACVRTLCVS